jgi:uncharacterized protein (DUF885 family)
LPGLLGFLLGACSRQPAPPQNPPPVAASTRPDWPTFAASFIESRFRADPAFAVRAGRHEFDGQMPDWSGAALEADVSELRGQLADLDAFDPASLTAAQRDEREYLRWVIESALFWQADADSPHRNPDWYLGDLDASVYLAREYAPLPQRLQGFLGQLRSMPRLAADIRANLRTPLPRPFIERGIEGFAGVAKFYREEARAQVVQLDDAALKQQLDAALETAARSMDELVAWLQSQHSTANDDFALGSERLSRMLRVTERVDTPLEELELLGRKELERNRAALEQACASFARPQSTLAACVAPVRTDKPVAAAEEAARKGLVDLRQFVIDRHIATVPGADRPLVAVPSSRRADVAYIGIPGPYERADTQVTFYVPPTENEYLLFAAVNQVWPGHYLRWLHARGNPSKIETLWSDRAFTEGWAHYAEEMMFDEGLGEDQPRAHVAMLANALLRDVRFLSAICLHSGCMTLAESEKMFREQAFTDAGNAHRQALGGALDPGYLADALGKLMIRRLRVDFLAAHPGATAQEFHDGLLARGAPPLPMARRALLGGGPSL